MERKEVFLMNRASISFIFAAILLIFSSCATAPPPVKEPTVFYPDPPNPPRIQFLKTFSGSSDLERPKSAFLGFILGRKDPIIVLDKPFGIAGAQGKIYVCDTNNTVFVLDLAKNTFRALPDAVQGIGKVIQPLNISVDKKGNKYVTDPVRSQVIMYDKDDLYVKAFGPIEGWKPVDAAAFEGLLYVVDRKSAEIKIFDIASGAFRNSIGQKGDEASRLGVPTNIAIDNDGYLSVADTGRFQIVKLDRDGNFRGTTGTLGRTPGSFARPRGIAIDRKNRMYVADASFSNVQVFDQNSQLLLWFGKPGQGPGDLVLPAKVAIDYDDVKYFQQYADPNFQIEYLILVTSQFSPRRVNVYGFGTEKGQAYKTNEQLLKELKDRTEKQEKQQQEKDRQQPEKPSSAGQKKD